MGQLILHKSLRERLDSENPEGTHVLLGIDPDSWVPQESADENGEWGHSDEVIMISEPDESYEQFVSRSLKKEGVNPDFGLAVYTTESPEYTAPIIKHDRDHRK